MTHDEHLLEKLRSAQLTLMNVVNDTSLGKQRGLAISLAEAVVFERRVAFEERIAFLKQRRVEAA